MNARGGGSRKLGWGPRRAAWGLALVFLGAATAPAQDHAYESRTARAAGRYGEALASAARVGEPGERALLELEARYWAGDLGGALRTARRGLEQAPEHLELLYYATLLPLDLAVPDLAADVLPRLELAARETPGLADDVRAGYLERCEGFAVDLANQLDQGKQRRRSASRAQLVVGLGVAAMVLATLGLLATPGSREPRG